VDRSDCQVNPRRATHSAGTSRGPRAARYFALTRLADTVTYCSIVNKRASVSWTRRPDSRDSPANIRRGLSDRGASSEQMFSPDARENTSPKKAIRYEIDTARARVRESSSEVSREASTERTNDARCEERREIDDSRLASGIFARVGLSLSRSLLIRLNKLSDRFQSITDIPTPIPTPSPAGRGLATDNSE